VLESARRLGDDRSDCTKRVGPLAVQLGEVLVDVAVGTFLQNPLMSRTHFSDDDLRTYVDSRTAPGRRDDAIRVLMRFQTVKLKACSGTR